MKKENQGGWRLTEFYLEHGLLNDGYLSVWYSSNKIRGIKGQNNKRRKYFKDFETVYSHSYTNAKIHTNHQKIQNFLKTCSQL